MRPQRRVLVVVRSPAAAQRLWDVVPLLTADPRLEVWFTVDTGSHFARDLTARLTEAGALITPWPTPERYDLAIAASDNTDLHRVDAPLVLLPHGAGYHRHSPTDPTAISGLRRAALLHNGHVVPHTIAIPHPHHRHALATVDPRLPDHALVTGDPCLDRLRANAFQRPRYRHAYQADGRTLVLLASTWGEHSLYGRHPDLPERAVTELPADTHRIVLTLHPNVWARHGRLQVESWLRPAITAGLVVVPPNGEWRPALTAADVVLADHGSLTCYAAATGTPVLLAADGGPEVVDGSLLADLRDTLPRLDHDGPLHPQLATGLPAQPDLFTRADGALTTRLYDILDLPRPTTATPTIPAPTPEIPQPPHFHVTIDNATVDQDRAILTITRRTSTWDDHPHRHLVAADHHPDLGVLERATAIWSTETKPADLLRAFPGARLAVTATGPATHTAAFRDGREVTAHGDLTPALACTALYWWSTTHCRTVEIAGAGALRVT